MKISENIHRIPGVVNVYFIIEGNDISLIDAGMEQSAKKVIASVTNIGYKSEAIKNIYITHSDPDHYGGANKIRESTGAKLHASNIEAEAMVRGTSSREIKPKGIWKAVFGLLGSIMKTYPTPIDSILEENHEIPILGGMKVLKTPGHTPGHISFYLPQENILFSGDSINSSNGTPCANTTATTSDPVKAIESFELQMALKPRVICAGHAYFDLRK
jgi:glyoxylase-like metal-dependent hydrolase (beta-lactamase superfamily II)